LASVDLRVIMADWLDPLRTYLLRRNPGIDFAAETGGLLPDRRLAERPFSSDEHASSGGEIEFGRSPSALAVI
jgi:hypothetical protein